MTEPDRRPVEPLAVSDLIWLAVALLLIIAAGYGWRDPWPADEPRFASLARDMATSGDWLFPRVGGDLYQDKPPVFFWLLAASYSLIGTIRHSFLLPSLLAAAGTLFLLYDLGRRLVSRRAGFIAALATVSTLQFVLVMRGAQIDGVLCLLTTLSLYGLLRHLVLGPAWGWYFIGGLAAGIGIITKGVGFLPFLLLVPYLWLRRTGWQGLAPLNGGGAKWWLAPLGMLLGVSIWLVPMLIAVAQRGAPEFVAYRDEILLQQTVTRYAKSWHHLRPWYYFIVEVIPALWLPMSALLFWLVPRWARAWRARDARVWLPLAWAVLVLVFFSASPGKRGVYLLPALPAMIIAAMPYLSELVLKRGVQRLLVALGAVLWLGGAVVLAGYWLQQPRILELFAAAGLQSIAPAAAYLLLATVALGLSAWRLPVVSWTAVLAALAVTWGFSIAPALDPVRSSSGFIRQMLAKVPAGHTLGLVAYKEQFLLYIDRPSINFGHRRWLEGPQEAFDAAAWLAAAPNRILLVPEGSLQPCFAAAETRILAGVSSDDAWYLVGSPADPACVAKGDPSRAIEYVHPVDSVTASLLIPAT
ncbi:MAG: glycosyltransferase family 39 protein [Steroidobacteraceae bacterium]